MTDTTTRINRLEQQINELLELCKRLGDDNAELRGQLQHVTADRASLLELKEQARSQVEAMITRLRSMENA